MKYSEYQYKILCEDVSHFNFIRGFLKEKGANTRRIESYEELPHRNSGKASVLKKFADRLTDYRSTAAKTNTIFIVAIDVDEMETTDMMQKFVQCTDEKVFFVIAKRNIETWFHFLTESPSIDDEFEEKDYKMRYRKGTAHGKLGAKLIEVINSGKELPPSLQFTYDNIKAKKQHLGLN